MADTVGWLTTREIVESFGFDPRPYEKETGEKNIRSISRPRKFLLVPGDMGNEKVWNLKDVERVKKLVAPEAKPAEPPPDPEPDLSIK